MSLEDNFKSIEDSATQALLKVTRRGGEIAAAAEDLEFFRASNPKEGKKLDKQNARLLDLTRRLLRSATEGTDVPAPRLTDAEAVDDNWQGIVDVIDNLLEKADIALDEYTGVVKRHVAQEAEIPGSGTNQRKSLQAHFGPKPQLKFNNPPTNDEITPFKPLLKTKPHATISLLESLENPNSDNSSNGFAHPYETEISNYRYPDRAYSYADPIPPQPVNGTEAIFVDTQEAVVEMLEELKKAKEIAVDLEHHDKHSYIGLVSLMQISTRDQDWIVDTLKPWREDLQVLNEVFADPSIIKVLHGAHSDIIWLQRDLGLYMVGLFDTYHASVALHYQRHSLAFLLEKFVDFQAQKKYQMADWRVRPLPTELMDYARSDTHFLLYIYDMMRNELVAKSVNQDTDMNLVERVLDKSKEEALQRYERPIYDAEGGTGQTGWYIQLVKTPALFKKEQFAAFRALHRWRDEVARKEDESLASVMLNAALFSAATHMPTSVSALLGCISPVSDIVRRRAKEVVGLIKEAQASGEDAPDMNEVLKNHPLTIEFEKRKAERQRDKAQRIATGPTLAKVIQEEKKQLQDTKAVVAAKSQFWGHTLSKKRSKAKEASSGTQTVELRLQVPLPPLTAEVYAIEDDGAVTRHVPTEPPEHEYKKKDALAPKNEDVFVLRDLKRGSKRKAEPEAEQQEESDDDEDDDIETPTQASKNDAEEAALVGQKQKKEERKKRKSKRKKQKQMAKQAAEEAAQAEAPFDYANAPSVLNAKPRKDNKTSKKTDFNPYAKSADAPKGMKKSKKEIGGKSQTFKS